MTTCRFKAKGRVATGTKFTVSGSISIQEDATKSAVDCVAELVRRQMPDAALTEVALREVGRALATEGLPVMSLTAEQQIWFDQQPRTPERINPCVRLYGPGPAGQTCKGCVHLVSHWTARRFGKCDLRRITHGPATDHKVRWPACAKYQPRAEVSA